MPVELSVIQSVASIGDTVLSMSSRLRSMKTVNKQDAIMVAERLRYVKAACRVRAYGELVRECSDQMEETLRHMQQKNVPDFVQEMNMELLRIQYEELKRIVMNYNK